MEYQFDVVEDRVLIVRTEGDYALTDNVDFLTAIRDNLEKHRTEYILLDYRKSTLSFDLISSFERPSIYESLIGSIRPIKIAIIFSTLQGDFKFYEDVCNNRGWNINFFEEYDSACDWLEIGQESD